MHTKNVLEYLTLNLIYKILVKRKFGSTFIKGGKN